MTKYELVLGRVLEQSDTNDASKTRPKMPPELIDMVLLESSYLETAIMLHRDWIAEKIIESIGISYILLGTLHNHDVEMIKFLYKIGSDYTLIKNAPIYNPSLPLFKR